MIRKDEQDFLDDITLKQASEILGVPIIAVSQDGYDLATAMFGIPAEKAENNFDDACAGNDEFYKYNPPKEGR